MRLRYVVVGGLTLTAGCSNPFAPGRSIILGVTRIEAPATVAPGAGFAVTFTVESGGCRTFVRGEATKSNSTLAFVARGRDTSGPNGGCPTDIRYDQVVEAVAPPISDPFTIVAMQPNGQPTTVQVRVQ